MTLFPVFDVHGQQQSSNVRYLLEGRHGICEWQMKAHWGGQSKVAYLYGYQKQKYNAVCASDDAVSASDLTQPGATRHLLSVINTRELLGFSGSVQDIQNFTFAALVSFE